MHALERIYEFWKTANPARRALALTFALRIFYSAVAAVMAPFLKLSPELIRSNAWTQNLMQPSEGLRYALLGVWERFDTLWYVHIAERGYDAPAGVVFYPLYPLLIRSVTMVGLEPLVAALMVSFAATFFLFWGLQKLFSEDLEESQNRRALLLCALWPTSFIFLAGYADSLVMALIVWSIHFARRGRWWVAGAIGFFAGLAKAVGLLAVIPLFTLALRGRNLRALPGTFALLGPMAYLAYLKMMGLPWPAEVYPEHWGTVPAWPWETLAQNIRYLIDGDAGFRLNFVLFLLAAGLSLLRNVRLEYLLYTLAALTLLLTKSSIMAQSQWGRYALILFPSWLNLARSNSMKDDLYAGLLAGSIALNTVLLRAFLEWALVV